MNKEKWNELFLQYCKESCSKMGKMGYVVNPADWPQMKAAHLEFIKNVDELTEVFNLENKVK